MASRSPSPLTTLMVRRASPSPLSRAQTWQAGQNAVAVPEEDVDREDADRTNRSVAKKQPNQLLSRPPMPLSSDHRHRRFSLLLLSTLSILGLLSCVLLLPILPPYQP